MIIAQFALNPEFINLFERLELALLTIARNTQAIGQKLDKLDMDQTTFDQDLAKLVNAINTNNQNATALVTAVEAYRNAHAQGVADLSTEDQAVKDAITALNTSNQNVTTELNALNPTPPPTTPPPTPAPAPVP